MVVPIAYPVGVLNTRYMAAFLALSFLLRMLLSINAVLLDDIARRRDARARDLALLILVSIVKNLGDRQITVWWRICAFGEYWRDYSSWGQMERRGPSNA